MNAADYFKHCRSLGAFTAQDCIDLSRQAAELDRKASAKNITPPAEIWHESMPDGSNSLRLSSGIKCF